MTKCRRPEQHWLAWLGLLGVKKNDLFLAGYARKRDSIRGTPRKSDHFLVSPFIREGGRRGGGARGGGGEGGGGDRMGPRSVFVTFLGFFFLPHYLSRIYQSVPKQAINQEKFGVTRVFLMYSHAHV